MQTNNWVKQVLPNAIAIVAFVIISAIFCAPAIKGERMAPHDNVSWIYLSKEARDYHQKTGEVPGWFNSIFSGMPSAALYETPGHASWFGILGSKILFQPADFLVNPIGYLFIMMLGGFMLLKSLKTDTLIAGFGAVAYALSTYIPILLSAGHLSKVVDLAYLAGVFGGIIFLYRGKWLPGIIGLAFFLSFFISHMHVQIIYYSLFAFVALGVYFFIRAIKTQKLSAFFKSTLVILLIAAASGLTAYTALKGTSNYSKYSMRGDASELTINKSEKDKNAKQGLDKDYAFSWSNGIGETFCAIVPNLYGGASGSNIGENSNYGEALSSLGVPSGQVEQMTANAPTYFGDQPFLSGPMYFGAIVCFLAIFALFVVRSSFKWVLLGIGFFFMIISWGSNFSSFNYWMFDNFPMFNKFRSPNMAMSFTNIVFVMLAFWGLYDFINSKEDKAVLFKKFKNASIVTLGLLVLIILYSQTMMSYKGSSDEQIMAQMTQYFGENAKTIVNGLRDDRASMALKDGLRSLLFIAVAILALWAFVKDKIAGKVVVIIIGLACTIDLWGVGKRYLNDDNFQDLDSIEQQFFTARPVDKQILQDKTLHFRVHDLSVNSFNDAKPSYFYSTIGGYHPAKMQSYQDLIEMHISKLNHSVLNMLNTKYIITNTKQGPMAIPNPEALGNAWFVSTIQYTKSADETMLAMDAPSIDKPVTDTTPKGFQPQHVAIIRDKYQSQVGASNYTTDSGANIVLKEFTPNYLSYESKNANEGFAVFSEVYYPENWKAYIDGKEVAILPVDYLLRGLKVPAGNHKIEFKFTTDEIIAKSKVNLVGDILLIVIIIGTIVYYVIQRRKKKTDEEIEPELPL